MDILKKKLSRLFIRAAEKLDKNVGTAHTETIMWSDIPIIKYDTDRFEYVMVRYTISNEVLKEHTEHHNLDSCEDIIYSRLTNTLAYKIIERHKTDIRKYKEWNGNDLTGNTIYELKLLVEKPLKTENND